MYIGSLLFSEFDLVSIGDEAALNTGATIQTHLFENRIIKSSYLKIGERCTVGNMSVVLYDTVMAKGSHLGSLSLLMKGETLPRRGMWSGIPCRAMMRHRPRLKGGQLPPATRSAHRAGAQLIGKNVGLGAKGIPPIVQPQLNFSSPAQPQDTH